MIRALLLSLALLASAEAAPPTEPLEAASGTYGYAMIKLPGGRFIMAQHEGAAEEPEQAVVVGSFWVGKTEVTQGLYERVMGTNPSITEFRDDVRIGLHPSMKESRSVGLIGDNLPVQNVGWLDAVAFANALSALEGLSPAYRVSGNSVSWDHAASGYRLLTNAEWEYAARAGASTTWAGTDEESGICRHGNVADAVGRETFTEWIVAACDDGYLGLAPVSSLQPNAWGVYDMAGNVSEWVWDRGEEYDDPGTDPEGPFRFYRDGCWSCAPAVAKFANHGYNGPSLRMDNLGFRLASSHPVGAAPASSAD